MKVALDCRSVFPGMGGIGRATAALARHLPAALQPGDELLLLLGARRPAAGALRPTASGGVRVEEICTDAAMIDPVFEQLSLPALALEHGAQVLHTTCFTTSVAADGLARVATVHDVVFRRHPELVDPGLGEYLDHWTGVACALAERVVTVSRFSSAEIEATYGPSVEGLAARLATVPNAVEESFFRIQRRPPRGVPFVLCVGALEAKKNVPALLRGFARLVEQHQGLPHVLVLAGGSGGQAFDLAREVARAGVPAERVAALGHVSEGELHELYATADAFAYLSEYEGFGLPPLEALAAGVPTLVADRASLPEIVGEAALRVDPSDRDAVARELAKLLADGPCRTRLAAAGPPQARRFCWERAAQKLVRVYGEALCAQSTSRQGGVSAERVHQARAAEEPALGLAAGGLGDELAFLVAARALAKADVGQVRVLSSRLLGAWPDSLLLPAEPGTPAQGRRLLDASSRHRVKGSSPDGNYLGTYLAALGLPPQDGPPDFELPPLEPPRGLVPGAYVAVQPLAFSARNPGDPIRYVERLVAVARQELPGWPVVALGDPRTTIRAVRGLDLAWLGGPEELLRVVGHAGLVLTPRSATAHVAAGHGVPAFVWVPEDGEDWHLDYPYWPHTRVPVDLDPKEAEARLAAFAIDLRRGACGRGGAVRLGLERAGVQGAKAFLGRGVPCPAGLLDLGNAPSLAEAIRLAVRARTAREPERYLAYLHQGNAVEHVLPEARAVCRGRGIDVGAGEFPLPGALPVRDEPGCNAYELSCVEDETLDYVFSSHCLEHLARPAEALALWARKLKPGGRLFLYLPHPDMEEWRPGSPAVPEHCWSPAPESVRVLVEAAGCEVLSLTELPDTYWSFRCLAKKGEVARG